MSGEKTIDMRRALWQTLSTDAELIVLVGARVYDNVPQGTAYPYIDISENTINDYGTKSEHGQEHNVVINVYDQSSPSRGQLKLNQICKRIYDLLHEKQLDLGGIQLTYLLRFSQSFVRRSPDGVSWHAATRYRALTSN